MANSSMAVGYSIFLHETCIASPGAGVERPQIETAHLIEDTGDELGEGERLYLAAWQEAEREGLE